MNSEKSKARVPQGLRPPPGFPSGVTVPTGPRASMQTKKLPPGPLKLGNRHIPSVLSPVSCTKMSYEEAVKDILKQKGPHLTRLKSMSSIETSVVLYDPRGGVLKACEGLHLSSDVSLCYLITWLQIFADNHVAKYHPGIDVVVRSVEIRFRNNQAYMSYPNLEGGLSYYNSNGIATACVNWLCDNSLMEQYWEVFRSAMQIGSDDETKYPIIRVKTVKYLAGDSDGMKMKKPLGGGHVFVVNEEDLDVHQYFDRYEQRIPDSLIQLDQWLTDSENKQIPQELADAKQDQAGGHSNPAQPRREGAKQAGGNNALDLRKSQLVQSTQGKPNTSPKITVAKITSELLAETGGKTKLNSNHASNAEDLPDIYHPVPNRQQLSKVVTIPVGDKTMQIPVPFRPPVHPDPGKNWRRFQRSGGISQLHDAFPLDHLVFDPKDMPEVATPPPIISIFDNGGQSNQNTGVNNKKATKDTKINNNKSDNTDSNKVTTGVTRDISDPYEAAVGFSSDDDEAFFPARNMKENVTSADINRLPKPIHRHGHRPSQNDTTIKDRKMHNKLPQGGNDVVANPIVASHKAPNKFELPKKKLTSTMNVNAPEFVNKSTSAWPPPGMEFMMNPPALGFAGHHLPAMGLPSMTMEFHPPPFPQLYLPPPMAMPGPFAPHPRPYPPRVLREPTFWAHPVYRTDPVAAAKPIANISKSSSNNNTRKQHIDHRGGRSKGSAALSNTIDELTRQVAQQTVGKSSDGEVKNEGFSKKTDDQTDTSHKSSSAANSKAGRGTKKEMS